MSNIQICLKNENRNMVFSTNQKNYLNIVDIIEVKKSQNSSV